MGLDIQFAGQEISPAFYSPGSTPFGNGFGIRDADDGAGQGLGAGPSRTDLRDSTLLSLLALGHQVLNEHGRDEQEKGQEAYPKTFENDLVPVPEISDDIFHGC